MDVFEVGVAEGLAQHANGTGLRQRVFHEIADAQVECVQRVDLVELLLEVVKADYGAGSAGFVGSKATERNNILNLCVLYGGGDRVVDLLLISAKVVAGVVGWNQDIS